MSEKCTADVYHCSILEDCHGRPVEDAAQPGVTSLTAWLLGQSGIAAGRFGGVYSDDEFELLPPTVRVARAWRQ